MEKLTFNQQGIIADIAKKIRQWREQASGRLTANEINSGLHILDVVMEHTPQLLENMPDDIIIPSETDTPAEKAPFNLTTDLICQAVAFDKRKKVLRVDSFLLLKRICEGNTTLNKYNENKVHQHILTLMRSGFDSNG